jgi:hypothetical protein
MANEPVDTSQYERGQGSVPDGGGSPTASDSKANKNTTKRLTRSQLALYRDLEADVCYCFFSSPPASLPMLTRLRLLLFFS